jgi:hypothetical protein
MRDSKEMKGWIRMPILHHPLHDQHRWRREIPVAPRPPVMHFQKGAIVQCSVDNFNRKAYTIVNGSLKVIRDVLGTEGSSIYWLLFYDEQLVEIKYQARLHALSAVLEFKASYPDGGEFKLLDNMDSDFSEAIRYLSINQIEIPIDRMIIVQVINQ